jgi:ADP-ribosylglycohydrolase
MSTMSAITLEDRFIGCLLGLAVGDALGGLFEAQSAEHLRQRFPTFNSLLNYPSEQMSYTDDTQMAIGVAETLVEHQRNPGKASVRSVCGQLCALARLRQRRPQSFGSNGV